MSPNLESVIWDFGGHIEPAFRYTHAGLGQQRRILNEVLICTRDTGSRTLNIYPRKASNAWPYRQTCAGIGTEHGLLERSSTYPH